MLLRSIIVIILLLSINISRSLAQNYDPHQKDGVFYNPFPGYNERSFGDFLHYMIFERSKKADGEEVWDFLPESVENDGQALRDSRDHFGITWIGHSTLLVQIEGVNILTDPIWSERASPFTFIGPMRLAPPGLNFSDLPPIDVVLLSHDHYDHLDKATIIKLGNGPLYLVPLGVGKVLHGMGINTYRELDWGEHYFYCGIDFVCAPAQHFSGRAIFNRNRTLWASWVIKGMQHRFYFGGDSGYAPFYRGLGEEFGPFDAAALPIGPVEPHDFMRPAHMDPQQALQASVDLKAKIFIPIHWGTFTLGTDPPGLAPTVLAAKIKKRSLPAESYWIPKFGETFWLR